MAMIDCPECGNQVSEQAAACPSCAHPISPVTSYTPVLPPKQLRAGNVLVSLIFIGLSIWLVFVKIPQHDPAALGLVGSVKTTIEGKGLLKPEVVKTFKIAAGILGLLGLMSLITGSYRDMGIMAMCKTCDMQVVGRRRAFSRFACERCGAILKGGGKVVLGIIAVSLLLIVGLLGYGGLKLGTDGPGSSSSDSNPFSSKDEKTKTKKKKSKVKRPRHMAKVSANEVGAKYDIRIKPNVKYQFQATGWVTIDTKKKIEIDPKGHQGKYPFWTEWRVLKNRPVGCLIGRIGESGKWFYIGDGSGGPKVFDRGGKLNLALNKTYVENCDAREFTVIVQRKD